MDDAYPPSISPNTDQHLREFAERQNILTSTHRRISRSLNSVSFTTGFWLAIFIPVGLIIILAVIIVSIIFVHRNRKRKESIEPFVLVSPMPKTPLPTGSDLSFSTPNSAMPILRKFDFEQNPDSQSILESVVSMSMAVTPDPSEVEEIYAQLEVLSTQVESLQKRDSSIYTSKPESIRRHTQETRRIQEDVEMLRLDINRLKSGSHLGHGYSNYATSTIAGSVASNFATANSIMSNTDSLTPLTRRASMSNGTVASASRNTNYTTNNENPSTSQSTSPPQSGPGPLQLLRDLALLRSEIDELLIQVQDVHGNSPSMMERLPSYSSRTHSRRPSKAREEEEPVPPLPPLPPMPMVPPLAFRPPLPATPAPASRPRPRALPLPPRQVR